MDREYQQRQRVLNSYRAFLSQKLEPALQKAHEERRKGEEKIADFRSLLTQIESLEKSSANAMREQEMRREQEEDECSPSATTTVRVDLGSEILCDLSVEVDATHKRPHVFVDVGLGFFCQLSFQEATALALKRIEHFTDEARAKKENEDKIVQHVEIVASGIKSLMTME